MIMIPLSKKKRKLIEITLQNIDAKHMAGMCISTSPANSQAHLVWKEFMPRRKSLDGPEDDIFYSLQEYPSDYPWDRFDPNISFTTWAAKEVNNYNSVKDGFKTTMIKGGLYAVFIHKGTAASISESLAYFHMQWLPSSGFMLDKTRKHFEKLGKAYLGPMNPESQEEVYIPILPNTHKL